MNNEIFCDETLSAFLDAELPEQQMEQIRAALLTDDNLANRLANLAMVDEVIANQYDKINQQPLPAAINELLAAIPEDSAPVSAIKAAEQFSPKTASNKQKNTEENKQDRNVVNLWQRSKQAANRPFALAASIAVAVGFFATVFTQSDTVFNDNWQEIAQVLEQQTSGHQQTLKNGKAIATQLTFINQQGDFCRQYDINNKKSVEHNIACRVNQEWQLTLTVHEQKQNAQNYQTATSTSTLREHIDNIATGDFFDKQQEQKIINNRWTK